MFVCVYELILLLNNRLYFFCIFLNLDPLIFFSGTPAARVENTGKLPGLKLGNICGICKYLLPLYLVCLYRI